MSVSSDQVIQKYIQLRDEKSKIEERHKEELVGHKNAMEKLEAWLQSHLQKEGLQSLKSAIGTAFLKEVSSATVEDRDTFFSFALNGHLELLDARCSKTVVDDFVEANGSPPPGVKYSKTQVVQIRRA
jgi:transposase